MLLAPPTSPPPARPVLDTARRQCLLCSPSCWLVDPATLTAWVSFATAQAGTPAAARRLVAAFWPYVPAAARQPLPPAAGDRAGAASSPSFPAATRPSHLPPPLFPLRTPCFLSFASSTPLLVPAVPSRRRSFWRCPPPSSSPLPVGLSGAPPSLPPRTLSNRDGPVREATWRWPPPLPPPRSPPRCRACRPAARRRCRRYCPPLPSAHCLGGATTGGSVDQRPAAAAAATAAPPHSLFRSPHRSVAARVVWPRGRCWCRWRPRRGCHCRRLCCCPVAAIVDRAGGDGQQRRRRPPSTSAAVPTPPRHGGPGAGSPPPLWGPLCGTCPRRAAAARHGQDTVAGGRPGGGGLPGGRRRCRWFGRLCCYCLCGRRHSRCRGGGASWRGCRGGCGGRGRWRWRLPFFCRRRRRWWPGPPADAAWAVRGGNTIDRPGRCGWSRPVPGPGTRTGRGRPRGGALHGRVPEH